VHGDAGNDAEARAGDVWQQGRGKGTSRGDAGRVRASDAEFIGAWRPGVWQVGIRWRTGLGLVLEFGLPMGETRLG
jgi:hypothetical protein